MGDSVAALLWLIVCVALVMGLAWWYTRYMAGRGTFGPMGASRELELRQQLPLGQNQRLALVRAGKRWLLLGVTASSISVLAEFTPEEAALWEQDLPREGETLSFREAFLSILKQGKERR